MASSLRRTLVLHIFMSSVVSKFKIVIMKKIIFSLSFLISLSLQAQHSLQKFWSTDTTLKTPESVYYQSGKGIMYVSNIDGVSNEKDGKGSIGILNVRGKVEKVDWVTGLNAPKGMGLFNGMLYVADLDAVAVIDVKKREILKRIPIEKAIFLNDITIDEKGIVYVSDTRAGKVYKVENDIPNLYLDSIKSPNGLMYKDNQLYILTNGSLLKCDSNKKLTTIATGMEASTDGLVADGENFIVSCWVGTIYYVYANGNKDKMLDTQATKTNSADIAFDAVKRILYVPTFYKNRVDAYELK